MKVKKNQVLQMTSANASRRLVMIQGGQFHRSRTKTYLMSAGESRRKGTGMLNEAVMVESAGNIMPAWYVDGCAGHRIQTAFVDHETLSIMILDRHISDKIHSRLPRFQW